MKIYHFPYSPNSRRVLAVAFHLGLEPELIKVDLGQGEQMRAEFLRLNPNHAIPVLVAGDFVLWESVAIMQYLANQVSSNTLWPVEPKAQADVSRWLCWSLAHWGPPAGSLFSSDWSRTCASWGSRPGGTEKGRGAHGALCAGAG